MTFDRSIAPGQRDRCLKCAAVLPQRRGHGTELRDGARGHAAEPGIQAIDVLLAQHGAELLHQSLSQGDQGAGVRQLGEVGLVLRAQISAGAEQEPHRLARRVGAGGGRGRNVRAVRAASCAPPWPRAPGGQVVPDVGGPAGEALRLDLLPQGGGVVAACGPARPQVGLVGRQQRGPPCRARALGKALGAQEALDGVAPEPHLVGDGPTAGTLGVQGPHLRIAGLPPCPTRLLLTRPPCQHGGRLRVVHRRRRVRQWGVSLLILGQRRLTQRVVLAGEKALQGVRDILDQVEAVRHLTRLRGALPCPLGIGPRSVPADHLNLGVLRQPGGHCGRRAIRKHRDRRPCLQVHHDGPVDASLALRSGKGSDVAAAPSPKNEVGRWRGVSRPFSIGPFPNWAGQFPGTQLSSRRQLLQVRMGCPHAFRALPSFLAVSLFPFALYAALPRPLVGRHSDDYYENSAPVGVAAGRVSRGTSLSPVRARCRCPTHPLAWPHWPSPAVQRVRRLAVQTVAHSSIGDQTVFRWERPCSERRLGFGVSTSHHGAQVLRHRSGYRRLNPPLSQHALVPCTFRIQVGWVTQERSSKFLLSAIG